jgi:hypothetical protein
LLDTYTETTLDSDLAVKELYTAYGQGAGLLRVSDPTVRLTKLLELEEGVPFTVITYPRFACQTLLITVTVKATLE